MNTLQRTRRVRPIALHIMATLSAARRQPAVAILQPGTKPAVGDLAVWVEEVAGTGTIDFSLTALYAAA